MHTKSKHAIANVISYTVMIVIGIIMCYPLIWMFFASFKSNSEIFSSVSLLPESYSWEGFVDGWKGVAGITYATFLTNSFLLVIPTVILTVVSSALTGLRFCPL